MAVLLHVVEPHGLLELDPNEHFVLERPGKLSKSMSSPPRGQM